MKLPAFASEMVNYQDGNVLFNIGDNADSAYVIMECAVDVTVETGTGTIAASTLHRHVSKTGFRKH